MDHIRLPFPDEPTAEDARPLVQRIVPILEAARQEEYIAEAQAQGYHLFEQRRPDVARSPETDCFCNDATEALVQLGIAFYAMHGNKGFSCDASARIANPQRYELERLLHESRGFVELMFAEVGRRRQGPELSYPTEAQKRVDSLVVALQEAFGSSFVVQAANMPSEEPLPSPTERVLREAVDYYRHILVSMEIM